MYNTDSAIFKNHQQLKANKRSRGNPVGSLCISSHTHIYTRVDTIKQSSRDIEKNTLFVATFSADRLNQLNCHESVTPQSLWKQIPIGQTPDLLKVILSSILLRINGNNFRRNCAARSNSGTSGVILTCAFRRVLSRPTRCGNITDTTRCIVIATRNQADVIVDR